jgi:glutamate-1-semialdehyde aminotransferase/predicted aldo/keto reductase-like oxidoreductase
MRYRTIGRTGLRVSVVGLGSAQLQMLSEAEAVATLSRGFELGVNWVHSAPDYGSVERWIQKAIRASGHDVMVAGTGTADADQFETYFENTCHWFERDRLDLFGINCVDDVERVGQNVWGPGGMVEQLQRKKAEGRLTAAFCTTHGSADYVERLIHSGVFDAIMLAYNPLGFHLLSYDASRDGRIFEDLAETRRRIFPLAAARGVSLLVMKVLGGGLLTRGQAFAPREWLGAGARGLDPADVIRLVLEEQGVTAVVMGVGSPSEAETNARAGHETTPLPVASRQAIVDGVQQARLSLCSRCGKCEPTCSRGLPISSMFRDAYIWSTANETFMADDRENYFQLHPEATLACATCDNRTCECPQGLDVPVALARVHSLVLRMQEQGQHPGALRTRSDSAPEWSAVDVLTYDVPAAAIIGSTVTARFLLRNVSDTVWLSAGHLGRNDGATAIEVRMDSQVVAVSPLRQNMSPGERSAVAIEVPVPSTIGDCSITFRLVPLASVGDDTPRPFWQGTITVKAPLPLYGARVCEHSVPTHSTPGRTWGVRVQFENTGALTWCADDPDGHPVECAIFIDDEAFGVLRLPRAHVTTGECVTVHAAIRAPKTSGAHEVRIELVHQHVAWFSAHDVSPLRVPMHVDGEADTSVTAVAFEQSVRRNLWHYQPTSGIAQSRDGHPFPLFISRASGRHVWDPEGHQYLDYTMGWGSTILGYDDPRIRAAAAEVGAGVTPLPQPLEMEVSEMLAEDFPSAEMVVFGKNGSDVCSVAARLARLETGRRVILSCGFHGWQDFGLDYFPFEVSGIPRGGDRSLHKFHYNDREGFLALYFAHRHDLAAIMIEPAGPMGGDELGPMPDADEAFLHLLAEAAREAGAMLIFDEIITGYRYRGHSVQAATGITPDLTCLGKALASGHPLSAVVGPARVFYDHFFKTHYCPTFKAEATALAAARAAIRIYRSEPVAEQLWAHGRALQMMLNDLCRARGVDATCQGPPFRFALWFAERDPYLRRLKKTYLTQQWMKAGILTVSGVMLPSVVHDTADVVRVREAAAGALDDIAGARSTEALARLVEIPLL